MKVSVIMSSNSNDYYGLKLLLSLSALLLLLAYTSFYLMQNYYSKSFLEFNLKSEKVYFLKSDSLKKMYEKNGMDYEAYVKRIEYFKLLCLKNSYDSEDVYSDDLSDLNSNSKLIVLDMMSLSQNEIEDIDNFVSNGGKMLFNFTSGFLSTSLEYQSDNLVSRITGLKLNDSINTIKFDVNSTGYMSTRLMSPLAKYLSQGRTLEIVLYDPLPIFDTPSSLKTDAYLTNWSQSNYLNISKNVELTKKQSGVLWHGYKEKGKWVYFSFPSYSFIDSSTAFYAHLFKGVLEFLNQEITPVAYPYIDAKNAVFVSEDTEYKYKNIKQFYDVSTKHEFPVTAFCVASLAEENRAIMKEVSKSKYFEIGSHSYTHKKIVGESDEVYEKETKGSKKLLKELTKQEIYGFRPPREEIDIKMVELLDESGFKYILGAGENRLTPHFNEDIMIIPRHGTDDYSYLINLDWDSQKILSEMKHQTNVLTDLNGIYTMSTHTHLMSFASNIDIVDKFFAYVKSQSQLYPMNGKMIYDRVSKRLKIGLHTNLTPKKLVMTFINDNSTQVQNIHYELHVDSNVNLKSIESEIIGVKTELIKLSKNNYTLIIKSMKPQSQMVLFLNYDKNI